MIVLGQALSDAQGPRYRPARARLLARPGRRWQSYRQAGAPVGIACTPQHLLATVMHCLFDLAELRVVRPAAWLETAPTSICRSFAKEDFNGREDFRRMEMSCDVKRRATGAVSRKTGKVLVFH
jgi:hypothetical protein